MPQIRSRERERSRILDPCEMGKKWEEGGGMEGGREVCFGAVFPSKSKKIVLGGREGGVYMDEGGRVKS